MGYYSDIAVRIKPRKDNDVCISFSIIKYNFVRGIEDKLGYDEANRLWSKAIFIENADEIINDIKDKKPLALFVAMGCPRQENFIVKYMDELPV